MGATSRGRLKEAIRSVSCDRVGVTCECDVMRLVPMRGKMMCMLQYSES